MRKNRKFRFNSLKVTSNQFSSLISNKTDSRNSNVFLSEAETLGFLTRVDKSWISLEKFATRKLCDKQLTKSRKLNETSTRKKNKNHRNAVKRI